MTGTDIPQAHSDINVNVGCGFSPTPGWLNFDNSLSVRAARWPGVPPVLRLAARLSAGSLQAIYSSHMIERPGRSGALSFPAEVLRVLSPGGALRIAAAGKRDSCEREAESVYAEAVRPR